MSVPFCVCVDLFNFLILVPVIGKLRLSMFWGVVQIPSFKMISFNIVLFG